MTEPRVIYTAEATSPAAAPKAVAEPDPDRASRIVTEAHRVCPYSKATHGNVVVQTTVNGRPAPSQLPPSE